MLAGAVAGPVPVYTGGPAFSMAEPETSELVWEGGASVTVVAEAADE